MDNVLTAAAMGRLDLVGAYVVDKETLKPGVPLIAPPWRKLPSEAKAHIELAFVWACKFGRAEIAISSSTSASIRSRRTATR